MGITVQAGSAIPRFLLLFFSSPPPFFYVIADIAEGRRSVFFCDHALVRLRAGETGRIGPLSPLFFLLPLDSIYRHTRSREQLPLFFFSSWREPDNGIWEVRFRAQDFTS